MPYRQIIPEPNLEKEYLDMKQTLYQNLFKAMITGFACMPFITSLRNLFYQDIWDLISNILISTFALVSSRFILKLHKPKDLLITIFLFIVQASYIPVYFSQQKSNPEGSAHAFYFAAINSLFEATITNRIPRFKYQAAFRLLLLLFKFAVVPIEDIGQVFVLILCSFFSIYLDFDREKHDQDLFQSYFNSREQLNKFKNLLANDLPEGIVILSQDLTRCLFANHSFASLIVQDNSPLDILASLHRFSLYEISETPEASESLPAFLRTLLKDPQHQKISCNLSYKTSSEVQSERIFQAKILSLIWDEQPSIALILSDVTQQNEIIRLKVAANLQKDRILATISHELRTPLNPFTASLSNQKKSRETGFYFCSAFFFQVSNFICFAVLQISPKTLFDFFIIEIKILMILDGSIENQNSLSGSVSFLREPSQGKG